MITIIEMGKGQCANCETRVLTTFQVRIKDIPKTTLCKSCLKILSVQVNTKL